MAIRRSLLVLALFVALFPFPALAQDAEKNLSGEVFSSQIEPGCIVRIIKGMPASESREVMEGIAYSYSIHDLPGVSEYFWAGKAGYTTEEFYGRVIMMGAGAIRVRIARGECKNEVIWVLDYSAARVPESVLFSTFNNSLESSTILY